MQNYRFSWYDYYGATLSLVNNNLITDNFTLIKFTLFFFSISGLPINIFYWPEILLVQIINCEEKKINTIHL